MYNNFWAGFEKSAEVLADAERAPDTTDPVDRSMSARGPRLDELTVESDRVKFASPFWAGFAKESISKKDLKIIKGGGQATHGRGSLKVLAGGKGNGTAKKFMIGMAAGGAIVGATHLANKHRKRAEGAAKT